jgi:lincosamide nucleotidyltransferase
LKERIWLWMDPRKEGISMDRKQQLLERLDEIGESVKLTGKAWALLSLGSVGTEISCLDEYSDLDFFVIAREGNKKALIDNLNWLGRIWPLSYCFRNTDDGYKVLFLDGIYCEFAVFEPMEAAGISYSNERIVWQDPNFDPEICLQQKIARHDGAKPIEWLLGEILTNLYVGLCRNKRGELLSAFRFIQVYAIERLIELARYLESEGSALQDQFSTERRFEQRFPETAIRLADFI